MNTLDEPVLDEPELIPPALVPLDVPEVVPLDVPELLPVDVPDVVEPPELAPVAVAETNVPQSSLVASSSLPRYRLNIGFCSALVTPKGARPGPTARMSTRRGIVPEITNPMIVWPFAVTVVRADTFSIGAAEGIAARPNVPVVVFVPVTVVYVPRFAPVNTRLVVVAGEVVVAGYEIVAVFGPVTT